MSLWLRCLTCEKVNDVAVHWHCPRCGGLLGYRAELIERIRARQENGAIEIVKEIAAL